MPKQPEPGTALATRDEAVVNALPALFQPVSKTESRNIPSIYLQAGTSTLAKQGITRVGDVVYGDGKDDPDCQWLIGGDEKRTEFTAYVLAVREGYARFYPGSSDMDWLNKDEFDEAMREGDRDVWRTYHYTLLVPDEDPYVPMRLMLTKTAGTKPARRINTMVDKALQSGDFNPVAVKFTVGTRYSDNAKTDYSVFEVQKAERTPEGLAAAIAVQNKIAQALAGDNAAPEGTQQPDL